jgi:hypothetical protein
MIIKLYIMTIKLIENINKVTIKPAGVRGGNNMTRVLEFPAERIAKGIHAYTPEMGERKVHCQLTANLSYYGTHYFVDTPELLPNGRGIVLVSQYTADRFTNGEANPRVGWYEYKVTSNAFEKMKMQYSISMERHLV